MATSEGRGSEPASAEGRVRRGPLPDRAVAEHSLPRTGLTHRRIVAAVALSAATPSALLVVEWVLDGIGGWELVRAVGPRPWWNLVLAAAVAAAVAPGGWIDRRRRRRTAAADGAPAPSRVSVRIGACAPAYSVTRAAWVAFWTTYVAVLFFPFHTGKWLSPLAKVPQGRFPNPDDVWWARAVALLLAAGLLAFAAARRFGRGRVLVTFPAAPLARGASADVHLGVSEGAPRIDRLRVVLRALRERPRGPLGWMREVHVAWEREAAPEAGAYVGPEREMRVTFAVPAVAPPTDLDASKPVHWEVLVLGRVGAGDFAARIPVRVV